MALQFSCPYCTAPVRVPDSAAGKLGKCPRCGTAVRIPSLSTASASSPEPPPAVVPVAEPVVVPVFDWNSVPSSPELVPVKPSESDPLSFDFIASASVPSAPKPPVSPRKESSKGGGWIIPVVLGLVLLGGFAYYKYRNRPVYHGTLVGERVTDDHVVAVIVRWDTIGVDAQTRQVVIDYFSHRPGVMVNPMMEMRFGALPSGLEIRFNPGQSADLVKINPKELKGVQILMAEEGAAWEQQREAELNTLALQMCQAAVQARLNETSIEGLTQYGRSVGINSLVRRLGYHVEAIHERVRYPCVMEDKDGVLFFLVPEAVRGFEVQERSDDAHQSVLPKEFRLTIQVPPSISETPRLESTMDEDEPAIETPAPTEPGTEPALDAPSTEEGAEGMKSMEMKSMEKSER